MAILQKHPLSIEAGVFDEVERLFSLSLAKGNGIKRVGEALVLCQSVQHFSWVSTHGQNENERRKLVRVFVDALHSRVLAFHVESTHVSAHIVLKGKHKLFWPEYLQDDAFLEVSQCFLPVAWQVCILRVETRSPFFPNLLVLLHVCNYTIESSDLAACRVENIVVQLAHKGWKRVYWLGVLLLLCKWHCST